MRTTHTTLILAVAVAGAGAYALLRDAPADETPRAAAAPASEEPLDDPDPELDPGDPGAPTETAEPEADDDAAAIAWTAPPAWRALPNPSSMRIATYGVPHAPGDADDAEVSVSRAGGDVDANIERWASQFTGATEPRRRVFAVAGMNVTLVEIEGAYTSGMDPGEQARSGWALDAAIVQSPGLPYFFKMTGPAATVHAASGAFEALLRNVRRAGELVDAGTADGHAKVAGSGTRG